MWEDYATKRGSMSEDYAMKRVLNVGGLCDDKGAECGRIMRGKGGTVCEDYATKRGLNVGGLCDENGAQYGRVMRGKGA